MTSANTRVAEVVANWPIPDHDHRNRDLAEKAAVQLQEQQPELWHEFCTSAGNVQLLAMFSHETRHRRGRAQSARIQQERADAGEALIALAEHPNDPDAIMNWRFVIDDDKTLRRLSDFTADDCAFAAAKYESTSRDAKFKAIFFRTLEKELRAKTNKDARLWSVVDVAKLNQLWSHIDSQTKPMQTKPNQCKPNQCNANQTNANQTNAMQTKRKSR